MAIKKRERERDEKKSSVGQEILERREILSSSGLADEIHKLGELREKDVLSEDEFVRAKAKLLDAYLE